MKKTLIAMVAVVLLASVAQAALTEYHWSKDKYAYTKVDGKSEVRWPFEYKYLTICDMPVKMNIGVWVEVEKCDDKKIILEQVSCTADVMKEGPTTNIGSGDFPCYHDCEKFKVRSNTQMELGTNLIKGSANVIDKWEGYYRSGNIVEPGASYTEATVCVKAWKAMLYNKNAGDEIEVGRLQITARPAVLP
jgi:hypothetical protein